MDWKKKSKKILLPILIFLSIASYAQDVQQEEEYFLQKIEIKDFNEQQWEKLSSGLDYEEKIKESKTNTSAPPPNQSKNKNLEVKMPFLDILLFIIAIALLAFLIYKLFGKNLFQEKNISTQKKSIQVNDVIEDIHETDLEKYLRLALEEKNFKEAIRFYYLMIIKELADKKFIYWKKDKTNSEYIREMQQSQYYGNFKKATIEFERSWYGATVVDEENFSQLGPFFRDLLKNISKN